MAKKDKKPISQPRPDAKLSVKSTDAEIVVAKGYKDESEIQPLDRVPPHRFIKRQDSDGGCDLDGFSKEAHAEQWPEENPEATLTKEDLVPNLMHERFRQVSGSIVPGDPDVARD